MGREARCKCELDGSVADVKIHLEPGLLTLSGGISRKLPTAELEKIKVLDDQLTFKVAGKSMRLHLGKALAENGLSPSKRRRRLLHASSALPARRLCAPSVRFLTTLCWPRSMRRCASPQAAPISSSPALKHRSPWALHSRRRKRNSRKACPSGWSSKKATAMH